MTPALPDDLDSPPARPLTAADGIAAGARWRPPARLWPSCGGVRADRGRLERAHRPQVLGRGGAAAARRGEALPAGPPSRARQPRRPRRLRAHRRARGRSAAYRRSGAAASTIERLFDPGPAARALRGPRGARIDDVILAEGTRWEVQALDPQRREAICRLLSGSHAFRRSRARRIQAVERDTSGAESRRRRRAGTRPLALRDASLVASADARQESHRA
jgi:hypothetical protein